MTRSDRSFPIGPRLLACCVALTALLFVAPAGAAPSADEVDSAHEAYFQAKQDVEAIQAQIAAIQATLAEAARRVEDAESELERIQAEIAATEERLAAARAEYEGIRARLNARAVQAFMSGSGSGFEIVLGATSLADLSDRIQFVDAVARSDAGLAQQVANLQAQLEIEAEHLAGLRVDQERQVAKVTAQRDAILDDLARVQALQAEAVATVERALDRYQELHGAREEFLRSLARNGSSSPHTSVKLPPGFDNPLEVCPVDNPRAFGDGFGAPRYVGGFHLHGGVDIVSNYGTPIRAPFDGTAKPTYNTLGGKSVYVYGATGYVYNAHLDHYSASSDGPVQAGDIIGYVGDSGNANGTPHDHFEWHPNQVPAGWPASYYGYAVVGSAVNPYPVLVDVCG